MVDSPVRQRLAAILAADVVGFSRLMGENETATIATLQEFRSLFRGRIEASDGRVVDMAGDSVLAVFDSAAGAVETALQIQADLRQRNGAQPEARQMLYRIGINLGDIQEAADNTVYGDGVNIAARLEAIAEPGTVVISGTAFDQVEGKLQIELKDLGEQNVKNISRPIRAYRAGPPGIPSVVGGQVSAAKPSIAVLPFANIGNDPEQEFFADGLAEDLMTALSRLRWLRVLPRHTAFTLKSRTTEATEIYREHSVRYVVEGSVRRGPDRIRVTVQLVDAVDGNQVWAERYDRALDDMFAL